MESYASALCNFKITKLLKTTTCYTNSLTFSAEKSQATSRNLGPVFLPKYIILTTQEKCFKESFFFKTGRRYLLYSQVEVKEHKTVVKFKSDTCLKQFTT